MTACFIAFMTVCVLSVYDSMGHSVCDHIHRSLYDCIFHGV